MNQINSPKQSNKYLLIGVGIVIVVLIVGVLGFRYLHIKPEKVTPPSPFLDFLIVDLTGSRNQENRYHFSDSWLDPNTSFVLSVVVRNPWQKPVDVYMKCVYPDGKSAWLYITEEKIIKFSKTPVPFGSSLIFDEVSKYLGGIHHFSINDKLLFPKGKYLLEMTVKDCSTGQAIQKSEKSFIIE